MISTPSSYTFVPLVFLNSQIVSFYFSLSPVSYSEEASLLLGVKSADWSETRYLQVNQLQPLSDHYACVKSSQGQLKSISLPNQIIKGIKQSCSDSVSIRDTLHQRLETLVVTVMMMHAVLEVLEGCI